MQKSCKFIETIFEVVSFYARYISEINTYAKANSSKISRIHIVLRLNSIYVLIYRAVVSKLVIHFINENSTPTVLPNYFDKDCIDFI